VIFKKKKAYVPYFIHTGDIVLLNRKYKYHKCLFAREIIFCYNTKSKGDVVCCFLRGRNTLPISRVSFKNTPNLEHSILSTSTRPAHLGCHGDKCAHFCSICQPNTETTACMDGGSQTEQSAVCLSKCR